MLLYWAIIFSFLFKIGAKAEKIRAVAGGPR